MKTPQVYSPSELAKHTSTNSCWIVIHGKVYDVTNFLEDHPGEMHVLLHAASIGDATKDFDDVGHSSTAYSMMENFFIGTVEGYKPKSSSTKARNRTKINLPTSNSFFELMFPLLVIGLALGIFYHLYATRAN